MLLRGSSHARLANSSRALKSDLTTSGSLLLPQGPARGRAPRAAPGDRGPSRGEPCGDPPSPHPRRFSFGNLRAKFPLGAWGEHSRQKGTFLKKLSF